MAISKAAAGEERRIFFSAEEGRLKALLQIAGNTHARPEYPFYYLKNDGLWILGKGSNESLHLEEAPSAAVLRDEGIWGALLQSDYEFLRGNLGAAKRICREILVNHFPESLFAEILDCLADFAPAILRMPSIVKQQVVKAPRSASFRRGVLVAYHYRCAVCGFGLNLADRQIGVEAAHIHWHAMGGPSEVTNGLALCFQHHKLFDLGIFTIDEQRKVEVSKLANGWKQPRQQIRSGLELMQLPDNESDFPADEYLEWHRRNVFKT